MRKIPNPKTTTFLVVLPCLAQKYIYIYTVSSLFFFHKSKYQLVLTNMPEINLFKVTLDFTYVAEAVL
jgi:hypothetical protein